jgi:hypothetical protein
MYKATQEQQAAGGEEPKGGPKGDKKDDNKGDDISDVDFEEVKDEKK